ncbi:MAG: ABC transporter ATP-binding protein [bacterium]
MNLLDDITKIRALVRPEARKYVLGLTSLFIINLSDVIAPLFLAMAIELTESSLTGSVPNTPTPLALAGLESASFTMVGAIAVYLVLQFIAAIFRYPMLMYIAAPSHQIGQTLRRRLAGHLLQQSQSWYDGRKSGDLMSIGTADVMAVRMMLGPGIMVGADTIMLVSMVLTVLFALSWKLALIALIPVPFIYFITNKLSHAEFKGFEAVQEDLGWMTERARESYAGVRIIQGYAREEYDRQRFAEFSQRHFDKNLRLARVRAAFDPTLDLMLGVSTALVLIFGGIGVVDGSVTLGSFVAFLFLIRYLSGPMIGLGWSISLFQRGRASMHRIDELLETTVAIQDGHVELTDVAGDIEVRNLTFTYAGPRIADDGTVEEPQGPVLHDVSFHIPAGRSLGIFGPVGSGKSSLVGLLTRLYDPPEGTVFVDGHDVRELTLNSLRQNIVLAPQETFLFSTTVARNIGLAAAADAEDAHIAELARLAQLHEDVDGFEHGYQTLLGERGVNLSGGQRQRLAIARAIGANPRVIVLDDCLSAVDAGTEEKILRNLREVLANRTGIVVSHRVRAVEACDEIVVIEDGRITARGTHEELLAQDGYYAQVAKEQTRQDAARAS